MASRTDHSLNVPRVGRRVGLSKWFDGESFGTLSEQFARYMGTSKFIMQMSVFIAAWFAWNTLSPSHLRFDPYTFTFLTLLLSLQASYAAPLILLAQNRQDDRDRIEAKEDRRRSSLAMEVNAFVSRELSDTRRRLNDISVQLNPRGVRSEIKANTKDLARRLDKIERALDALVKNSSN